MTRLIYASVIVLGMASSVSSRGAAGSAFGTLATASAMGQGRTNLGFGIGVADATSFTGSLTYGLTQYTDGRVRIGLIDADGGSTEFTIGADFNWQFWDIDPDAGRPFDFAVGGFLEYADFGYSSVFQLGGQLIGSYPIRFENGGPLVPYGRFNIRLESVSTESIIIESPGLPPSTVDGSDSNLELGVTAGVQWIWTPTMSLFGEIQLDGNDGVFIGIDFNLM